MKYKNKIEAQADHICNYRSDGIAKGKGSIHSSDYYRVAFIIENTPENSYVLDVGCNGGTLGVPLINYKNCYVKGIDIVDELVEKAKIRGIFAEKGEAEDLSRYEDNKFDVVLCAEVLEHLYDPLPAIEEAYRVLKPGGKYIVTVPSPGSDMCNGKLGDYHQQNFSSEILNTLFNNVFEKGKVTFITIPYSDSYCKSLADNREELEKISKTAQWIGLIAIK